MNIVTKPISEAGNSLAELSGRMYHVSARAQAIDQAISHCYMQGGVGGRVGGTAVRINSIATAASNRAEKLLAAANIYSETENRLLSLGQNTCSSILAGYNIPWTKTSAAGSVLSTDIKMEYPLSARFASFGSCTRSSISSVVSGLKTYFNRDRLVGYGKCALKAGKGAVKIVGAAAAIFGECASVAGIPAAVASAPIAVTTIISGINDIASAACDGVYVHAGRKELVGTTNVLKDAMKQNYGDLGELLGNREAGEQFGELTYTGLDLVSFLDGTDKMLKAYGKLNTDLTETAGWSFVWGETHMDDILDDGELFKWTDLIDDNPSDLTIYSGLARKFLKWDPSSTMNLVYEAVEKSYKTYRKGSKLAGKLFDIAAR